MSCNCSLTNTPNTTSTLALVVKESPKPAANQIIASQLASLLPMWVHAWTTNDDQLRASNMRNEAIENVIGAIVHKFGTFSLSVYETDAAKPPK